MTADGIEPDLDDSAKASIILSIGGKTGFSEAIVREFDSTRCLTTYHGERDPSVTANCNALVSLLYDDSSFEAKQFTMEKIINFIITEWSVLGGKIKDKWVC